MDEAFRIAAQWYDGTTAIRHTGELAWDGRETLTLDAPSAQETFAASDLRFGESRPGQHVYHRESLPDFRLMLADELPAGLASKLPAKSVYGGWIDRVGLGKAAAGFAVVSAAAVALFLTAPDWLGPRIPDSWERNIGEAMVGDLGNRVCRTPEGDAALAKLLAKELGCKPSDVAITAGTSGTEKTVTFAEGSVTQAQIDALLNAHDH